MSYKYPRERKRIFTINGGFDDFSDPDFSEAYWKENYDPLTSKVPMSQRIFWSIVSAPGGVGGNAFYAQGQIFAHSIWEQQMCFARWSPWQNRSYQRMFGKDYLYWKCELEARLYIESDRVVDFGGEELGHSMGFCLDGSLLHEHPEFPYESCGTGSQYAEHNGHAVCVLFNVASQKAGIVIYYGQRGELADYYKVAWSGSLDTWYDIRIVWYYDWYNNMKFVPVTVYVNKTQLFQKDIPLDVWLDQYPAGSGGLYDQARRHHFFGRCGLVCQAASIQSQQQDQWVKGYFKDVCINRVIGLDYKTTTSIMAKGTLSDGKAVIANALNQFRTIQEGNDFQIWERRTLNDDWNDVFRGVVRKVTNRLEKLITIEAEGYDSVLLGERIVKEAYSAKTADEIIVDLINKPTKKWDFNLEKFLDATVTTYSPTYMATNKLDVFKDLSFKEDFNMFLDNANAWHFAPYRDYETDIHIEWGSGDIIGYEVSDLFANRPNMIKLYGSGVMAQRELPDASFGSGSEIVREIFKPEYTTKAECETGLDYYANLYSEAVKILTLSLVANYSIKRGNLIRVSIPKIGARNRQYLVTQVSHNSKRIQTLELLEAKPSNMYLMSELYQRQQDKEGETIATDTETSSNDAHLEGTAETVINARYEIEYDSEVVRSGEFVVTDVAIDGLIDMLAGTTVDDPTHIAYGTGSTLPKFSDTALESESSIAAATKTYDELAYEGWWFQDPYERFYRSIKFEADFVSGVTSLSEIGLFDAASSGDMHCRTVLDSAYTETGGTVTIRIWFTVWPVPNSTFINIIFMDKITNFWYDGTNYAFNHIVAISMQLDLLPGLRVYSNISCHLTQGCNWCPDSDNGTLTKNKFYNQNKLQFVYVYTYDETDRKASWGVCDTHRINGLAIKGGSSQCDPQFPLIMAFRNEKYLSDWDGYDCRWVLNLKFIRGDEVQEDVYD